MELSHLNRKNKYAAKVGHPAQEIRPEPKGAQIRTLSGG